MIFKLHYNSPKLLKLFDSKILRKVSLFESAIKNQKHNITQEISAGIFLIHTCIEALYIQMSN